MTDIQFLTFTDDHLDAATALSRSVGWPHQRDDWQMLLAFSSGCIAITQDRVVGTALRTDFGANQSTINMVIVSQDLRGQGLGHKLMRVAMEGIGQRRYRLISTVLGRPLYEKFDFTECHRNLQHQGVARPVPRPDHTDGLREGDLDQIKALEAEAYGGDRAALIAWLAAHGELAVVRDGAGLVRGYAACRAFGKGRVVGPVVAPDKASARSLIAFFAHRYEGQFLRIDTADSSGLSEWLSEFGLAQVDVAPVMHCARSTAPRPRFAIFSQALG